MGQVLTKCSLDCAKYHDGQQESEKFFNQVCVYIILETAESLTFSLKALIYLCQTVPYSSSSAMTH